MEKKWRNRQSTWKKPSQLPDASQDEEIRIHPFSPRERGERGTREGGKTDDAIPGRHYTNTGAVFYLGNEPSPPRLEPADVDPTSRSTLALYGDSRLCLWKLPIKTTMNLTIWLLLYFISKLIINYCFLSYFI